jgi:hypothetical protein
VSSDPALQSLLPSALEEAVSGGLNWHDGETEGPELLPMLQSAESIAAVPAPVGPPLRPPPGTGGGAALAAAAPDQTSTGEEEYATRFTHIPAPPSPFQQDELQHAYDAPRRPIPAANASMVGALGFCFGKCQMLGAKCTVPDDCASTRMRAGSSSA